MSIVSHNNQTANGTPIVVFCLRICKIRDNTEYGLQSYLTSIFSVNGKVWLNEIEGKSHILIGYDNTNSLHAASIHFKKHKLVWKGKKLRVQKAETRLMNAESILNQKLSYPNRDINQLTKCNNYFNKYLFPINIISNILQTGGTLINPMNPKEIYCYHSGIKYPFFIHMLLRADLAKNRIIRNIIHIRPQSPKEIGEMLYYKSDISLLKQILPRNYMYNVDWRYFDLWWDTSSLLYNVAKNECKPHQCIKYLIDVIKCDPNDIGAYQLLHTAAYRHDIDLVNMLLNKYRINPLKISQNKYRETALDACKVSWKRYLDKYKMHTENMKNNTIKLKSLHLHDNDIEFYEDVYIRSIFFEKCLYIWKYGVGLIEIGEKYKQYGQFSLQLVQNKCYIIKVKPDSQSFRRICEYKGWNFNNIDKDIVLTANIINKSIHFDVYNKINSNKQHWFICYEIIGNDKYHKLYIFIKDSKYELAVSTKPNSFSRSIPKLELKQIGSSDQDDDDMKEGRNLDDVMNSLFVLLKKPPKRLERANYETEQIYSFPVCLKGDIENNRRVHTKIVELLQNAMKIQKLHGVGNIEDKKQKVINKPFRYKGIVKRYYLMREFGFITIGNNIYNVNGDIFVHKSEIKSIVSASGSRILIQGQHVEFDIVAKYDGKRKAINVTVINDYDDNKQNDPNNIQSHRYNGGLSIASDLSVQKHLSFDRGEWLWKTGAQVDWNVLFTYGLPIDVIQQYGGGNNNNINKHAEEFRSVVLQIFHCLSFEDLSCCNSVCKIWNKVINRAYFVDRSLLKCYYSDRSYDSIIKNKQKGDVDSIGLMLSLIIKISHSKSSNNLLNCQIISSSSDLISYNVWNKINIHIDSKHEEFTHFLPIIINNDHYRYCSQKLLPKCIANITSRAGFQSHYALSVMSSLLNSVIMSLHREIFIKHNYINKNKYTNIIKSKLKLWCRLHHVLLQLCVTFPAMQDTANRRIKELFDKNNSNKLLSSISDLGIVIMYLLISESFTWNSIRRLWVEERFTRDCAKICDNPLKYVINQLNNLNLSGNDRLNIMYKYTKHSRSLTRLLLTFLTLKHDDNLQKQVTIEEQLKLYNSRFGSPNPSWVNDLEDKCEEILDSSTWNDYFTGLFVIAPSNKILSNLLFRCFIKGKYSKQQMIQNSNNNNQQMNNNQNQNGSIQQRDRFGSRRRDNYRGGYGRGRGGYKQYNPHNQINNQNNLKPTRRRPSPPPHPLSFNTSSSDLD